MSLKQIIVLLFFTSFLLITESAFALEAPDPDELPPRPQDDLEIRSLSLGSTNNSNQWHLKAVDNEYDFSGESNYSVTVAILDSGINRTSDLSCHNFVGEYNAITGESGPFSASDGNGHGTYVAEIIAGCLEGNDGRGIASGVKIMPVKVLDDSGNGSMLSLIRGIYWATINGADIINMSLGVPLLSLPRLSNMGISMGRIILKLGKFSGCVNRCSKW